MGTIGVNFSGVLIRTDRWGNSVGEYDPKVNATRKKWGTNGGEQQHTVDAYTVGQNVAD